MDRIQIANPTLLIEYELWILIKCRKSAVDTTNVSSSLVPRARDSVIRAWKIKIFDVEQEDEILFLHQRRSGQRLGFKFRFKGWYPRNLFTFSFFSFRHFVLNHADVGVSSSVYSRVFLIFLFRSSITNPSKSDSRTLVLGTMGSFERPLYRIASHSAAIIIRSIKNHNRKVAS